MQSPPSRRSPGRFLGCLGVEAEVGGALGEVGGEPRGEACGGAEGETGGDTGGEILLVAELLLRVGRRQLEEGGRSRNCGRVGVSVSASTVVASGSSAKKGRTTEDWAYSRSILSEALRRRSTAGLTR